METSIQKKLDAFFNQFKTQAYKKGEILIRADENPAGVFYLKKGKVKMYAISKKGDELVLNIFKPYSFFPMSWAINQTQNKYFYEAMTDLELCRVPKDTAIKFIKNTQDVLYNLLSRVYKGTDGLLTRMAYLMSGSAYARLITELLIVSKRFGRVEKGNITVLTITEKELGTQTGMSRETISREIKNLKDKGLVSLERNRLIIKDIKRLEEEIVDGI